MWPSADHVPASRRHTSPSASLRTRMARDLRSKPLAEVLERKRRERAGSTEGIAAAMPHGLSGVDETKPLAFRKS